MRDYLTRVWQYLGVVMGPQAPERDEPLPAPPTLQEHHANVEFMADCLFGLTAAELGLTAVPRDDI